ncbi:Peroxidase superfamily protein [Trifolium repens]|nr:Peroxidase superfamily protein [Trifolium repens]
MKFITILMIFFFVLPFSLAQLRFGYYSFTCPLANEIVSEAVQNYYQSDITIVGALIRLHFHDCISNGCDASILIDSTENRNQRKMQDQTKRYEDLT